MKSISLDEYLKKKTGNINNVELISKEELDCLLERILHYMKDFVREFMMGGRMTRGGYWIAKKQGVKLNLKTGDLFDLKQPNRRYPIGNYIDLYRTVKEPSLRKAVKRLTSWVEQKEKSPKSETPYEPDYLHIKSILWYYLYYRPVGNRKQKILSGTGLALRRKVLQEIDRTDGGTLFQGLFRTRGETPPDLELPEELKYSTLFKEEILQPWTDGIVNNATDYFFEITAHFRGKKSYLYLRILTIRYLGKT
jgi:hypothetical protein